MNIVFFMCLVAIATAARREPQKCLSDADGGFPKKCARTPPTFSPVDFTSFCCEDSMYAPVLTLVRGPEGSRPKSESCECRHAAEVCKTENRACVLWKASSLNLEHRVITEDLRSMRDRDLPGLDDLRPLNRHGDRYDHWRSNLSADDETQHLDHLRERYNELRPHVSEDDERSHLDRLRERHNDMRPHLSEDDELSRLDRLRERHNDMRPDLSEDDRLSHLDHLRERYNELRPHLSEDDGLSRLGSLRERYNNDLRSQLSADDELRPRDSLRERYDELRHLDGHGDRYDNWRSSLSADVEPQRIGSLRHTGSRLSADGERRPIASAVEEWRARHADLGSSRVHDLEWHRRRLREYGDK